MKKIVLSSGKSFSVSWCGTNPIDGYLRAEIKSSSLVEVFTAFSHEKEIEEIKYYMNDSGEGQFRVFSGFTTLKGVTDGNNGVVIALAKGD